MCSTEIGVEHTCMVGKYCTTGEFVVVFLLVGKNATVVVYSL